MEEVQRDIENTIKQGELLEEEIMSSQEQVCTGEKEGGREGRGRGERGEESRRKK